MHFEIMYIVFLVKIMFLEIKKISDALLRSDARADQNQVPRLMYLALCTTVIMRNKSLSYENRLVESV